MASAYNNTGLYSFNNILFYGNEKDAQKKIEKIIEFIILQIQLTGLLFLYRKAC
jgi:hypothetical protein